MHLDCLLVIAPHDTAGCAKFNVALGFPNHIALHKRRKGKLRLAIPAAAGTVFYH